MPIEGSIPELRPGTNGLVLRPHVSHRIVEAAGKLNDAGMAMMLAAAQADDDATYEVLQNVHLEIIRLRGRLVGMVASPRSSTGRAKVGG